MLVVAGEVLGRQFKLSGNISIKAGQQIFPLLFFVPVLCRGVRHWNNRKVNK